MNKIYKVMYSKVKQCAVVVSEIAKSHGRHTKRSVAKSSAALTVGVLIALGSFSFEGMPVAQADGIIPDHGSVRNNDFVGANDYYWYYDEKEKDENKKWKTYQYKATDIFNNRSRHDLPNYQGAGAKLPGAITAGLYAQAGQQTVTIGDRNAGESKGSVFIGEHSGYNDGANNLAKGGSNNYVTSVGFQSDATGWGSIAIGSNAIAENSKTDKWVVEEDGKYNTSGTVDDDTYSIKANPTIEGASVALGYNAHSKDGNIAIGANSDATSTDKGDSYVSVGNGTLKRRITNVANGTDNSDVVTVGQMNDAIKQADNLNVNAGWGINVADENDPTNTGKGTKNVISLKHNLGTGYNDDEAKGMIIGGLVEDRDLAKQYGAADANSVIVGAGKALASGKSSVVVGGLDNVASGATSVVIGGDNNNAAGNQSAVFGGRDNKAAGVASTASGGIMNAAVGQQATAIGGSHNYVLGVNATAVGGLGRDYANGEIVYDSAVRGDSSVGIAGGSTGENAIGALAAGHQAVVTTENGTAIGYQATTDEANTIAFGHDAGDVSGYTIEWNKLPENQVNADGTTNDYTKAPKSVTPTMYKDAYYNRLVKVADGIDDHDVVVMKQLKQYAEKDASNIGANLKGADGKTAAADAEKTTNENAWGEALGTGTVTKDSKQLVTGSTVYNEVRPSRDGKYVKMSQTTGANLIALDDQVKQNAQNISDNTYAQGDGILMDKTKKTISVNKGDGLKFYEGKLAVDAGNGLKIDNGAVAIKTSDSNLKVDSNGIGLSDKITIGSDKTKQVIIDGTKGEISGLTNTTWDSKANDYSKSTKAATESQVDAAVKDAVKQAGDNDTHVEAGSYAVDNQHQISMNLVDNNNNNKGTVTITDVAKASEMGDVSQLNEGVQNADGNTTTVVDAINNVNENVNSVDRKVGDLNYFEQNDGKTHTVTNGTSITKAIGDLDSAVQNATEQAGKHTIVSTKDTNLDVKNIAKDGEAANYQIALNQDLNVNTVTAKTVTTDNLTVNKSATIGGVTIANKTISGLDDTKIEKDSPNATNAVNERTIYNELRPTSDGSYIKQTNTTAQNLTSLDTQVRATHDLINSDGKTIKIGGSDAATKIDVNGKDGKGRVITGVVSDANDPNSAANVGYVNGLTAANTQQIYRDMNNAYGRLNNNINKAAAGSNALAALHPLDYDPDDKADFAVGYGHYRNANAAAVGAFYHPNENTMVNVGVSLGNGDPGFNAGVSFKVGRGGAGREAMSKTEMAKVINSQSKEIDALKKDNADKDKRIDALEQKMAEILAKLDKNGK